MNQAFTTPRSDRRIETFEDRRDPGAIQAFLDGLAPWLERVFSPEVRGVSNVPDGAALLVANHNAGVLMPDVFVLGDAIAREKSLSALPHVLVHDAAFRVPSLARWLDAMGGVRARPDAATRLFASGRRVLVYPGGDSEVFRPYRARHRVSFGQRRGYIKLALREGVPICPVVTAGAHEAFLVLDDGGRLARAVGLPKLLRVNVLPTVLSFPWGLTVGVPPPYVPVPTRIVMEVLPPMRFERTGEEAARDEAYVERCHDRVVDAMQRTLDALVETGDVGVRARFRRWPGVEPVGRIAEELAERIVTWTEQVPKARDLTPSPQREAL